MPKTLPSGAHSLVATLESLGVQVVFGLPGTQTLHAHEALRTSSIKTVTATHELAASFMAGAYFRASDSVGVLLTIAGPGFTYAQTGLAQARADSAAVVHLVCKAPAIPNHAYQVQAMDERSIVASIVKGAYRVRTANAVQPTIVEAFEKALEGEPGPTMVLLEAEALAGPCNNPEVIASPAPRFAPPDTGVVESLARRIRESPRVIMMAGQGANSAAREVTDLAELLAAPVFTTSSGRGIISDDHPLALGVEPATANLDSLNEFIATADMLLVLGCKMGDSGTAGFRLAAPAEKLVRIDTSPEVLASNYPSSLPILGDVRQYVAQVAELLRDVDMERGWSTEIISELKETLRRDDAEISVQPRLRGTADETTPAFFRALGSLLPKDVIVTTDSGQHQYLVRRNLRLFSPRGLIIPGGFQSMGCAIPAAIGAALAAPDRPVIAVLGDGGFAMCGMELLTAIQNNLSLTVIVLNDGHYGLIRMQQLFEFGHSHAVKLQGISLRHFADAIGAKYVSVGDDIRECIDRSVFDDAVTIVEVAVSDSDTIKKIRAKQVVKDILPDSLLRIARAVLRRGN